MVRVGCGEEEEVVVVGVVEGRWGEGAEEEGGMCRKVTSGGSGGGLAMLDTWGRDVIRGAD